MTTYRGNCSAVPIGKSHDTKNPYRGSFSAIRIGKSQELTDMLHSRMPPRIGLPAKFFLCAWLAVRVN